METISMANKQPKNGVQINEIVWCINYDRNEKFGSSAYGLKEMSEREREGG